MIIVINEPGDGRPVIWSRPSVLTMASISLTLSDVYVLLVVPVVLPRKTLTVLQGNVKWKLPVRFKITKFC